MIIRNWTMAVMLSGLLASNAAIAQEETGQKPYDPDTAVEEAQDKTRYQLRETENGVIRLDKRTGAMSFCSDTNGKLVCRLGADEREAYQQALSAMEGRLKAAEDRIDALESSLGSEMAPMQKRQDRLVRPPEELQTDRSGPQTGESETDENAPSSDEEQTVEEREFDRALEFSQRAMRRFFEVIQDLRREMELETEPSQ